MITNYTVTVKFGCTQSVGNYSNVRPEFEISLSGQGDGQEAHGIAQRLLVDVREQIHDIVDQELEIRDEHLLYYQGETFSLVAPKDFHYLAIVSDAQPLPKLWSEYVSYRMGSKRLERLQWLIKEKHKEDSAYTEDIPIVDVQDLPVLEKFTVLKIANCLVLLSGDRRYLGAGENLCSAPPKEYYARQTGIDLYIMDREHLFRRVHLDCQKYGLTLVDCLDGDFSRLPALPELPPEEPKDAPQEENGIPFEDEDDDVEEDEE